MSIEFKALVANIESNNLKISIQNRTLDDLPDGDTVIEVKYSSLNYKDGMALNGNKGKIMRNLPMSPGIDLAGIVKSSSNKSFSPGDEIIVTGWGLGETHSGGYSEIARVNSEWIVKKPDTISLKNSMSIGTAGLTAMLSVMDLENSGINNSKGEVLVTGAAGGVGNISILILNKLGYSVTAVTGRPELEDYLRNIGATKIIGRDDILKMTRPLNSIRWDAAIDTTGGEILSKLISSINYEGAVACCGNAAGIELSTTVLPLLLRGVKLLGINSVNCPIGKRVKAWDRLGDLLNPNDFETITNEIDLNDINKSAKNILLGEIRGRTVVNINGQTGKYQEIFKGY